MTRDTQPEKNKLAEEKAFCDGEVFDEDEVESYLVDENGNEIGFTVLDEEGNEIEYFYLDDEDDVEDEDNEFDFGITKEGVAKATGDLNNIYKEGTETARELKGALDDIKDAFNLGGFFK